MKTIIDFKIIENDDLEELVAVVKKNLDQGWQPLQTWSVPNTKDGIPDMNPNHFIHFQSLVRYD